MCRRCRYVDVWACRRVHVQHTTSNDYQNKMLITILNPEKANLSAAMCSFGGLYLGLSVALGSDAETWMLACVTGLFIYISLVDIVSTIRKHLRVVIDY